ncbi:MAG: CHAT domain-containing protein, partial [Actinomycetota bacterium]|nr:CHAT domain-containing protein [Actinomycetota bacterium]
MLPAELHGHVSLVSPAIRSGLTARRDAYRGTAVIRPHTATTARHYPAAVRQLRIEVLSETALRLVGPAGEVLGRRELAVGEIDALVDEVTRDYEGYADRLRTVGERLYAWLDGSGQRWLTKARESLRGEVLCLRLDVGHRLHHLPWELAAVEGAYLVANPANPFCPLREVDKRGSEHQVANRPLRALFMASSPEGVSPLLDFEAEEARILAAAGAGGVDLVVEERGSLGSLAEILKRHAPGHFDVVHLSGHADVTDDLGPHVLLETDTGALDRCTADRLIAAVEGHWPRVLFVSGCRTGQSPERGVAPSFAEQLVRAGAPCVVGWGQPVGDVAASAVAAALYARMGNGEDPATAVARARWEALDQGFRDWHLLRVYVDGSALVPLVSPPATPGRPRIQLRPAHREFLDADQRSPVCAADRFVGRRRVLQRCLRSLATLDQTSPNYAEGVVLHGMGGLGKSSLAARLCERLRTHRRLVWVGPFDEGELVRLMNAKLDATATGLLNQPDLPLRSRLRDVLDHLDATGAPPLLFVLDDFEHNVEGHDDGHPRLVGPGGSGLLTTDALDALDAVAWAIRETASPSRVIITCRYVIAGPPAPVRLVHVGLEAMAGAELTKKTAQLARLGDPAADADLRGRAVALADGNPRLLELLDKAMDLPGLDSGAVLASLAQVTADFRERVLVNALLDAQSDGTRCVLACLAVCRLAVDAAAVSAIANADATAALAAAVAAGLVESGPDPATSTARYRVLALVTDLLAEAITDDERTAATERAATHLYEAWWATREGLDRPRALELWRLCKAAGHFAHAIGIANAVTAAWQRQGRYAEAVALMEQVVGDSERLLGPDHPDTVMARAN